VSEKGDPAKVEALIDEELKKVIESGITDAELQKAKNIFLSDFWRNMQTINGKAYALGNYEVFHGDYRKLFEAPAIYDAVTKEQLQQVAKKVFRPTNRTIGVLKPVPPATPAKKG
jgi:zinc protease